jgi:hypothetical protein
VCLNNLLIEHMRNSASLLVLSSILVACGGGGSDAPAASNPSPAPAPAAKATFSDANYIAVAQESLSSSNYLADAGTLAVGAEVNDADVLVRFAQAQAGKLPGRLAGTRALVTGATTSTTDACSGGGTLTTVENDSNGNGLPDAGDSVSLTATNCIFQGSTLNGGLTLVVNAFTGNANAPPFAATMTLTFTNLTAKSAAASSTGNGTMVLSLNAPTSSSQTVSLKSTQFTSTATYGSTTYSRTLNDYTVAVDLNATTSKSTAVGTLSSSAFDSKAVTIATPVPFVRVFPQTRPSSGQATATGANGAVVRVTAISNTQVKIELDADANGSFETTVTKLWSELI